MRARLAFVATAVILATGILYGATNETSRVLDCGGGISSNAHFVSISAFCQGVPVGFTANQFYLNQGGFLHSTTRAALVDDQDGDRLTDWDELTGVASAPLMPSSSAVSDSDGDGLTDGEETMVGTNPLDARSLLSIVDAHSDGSSVTVTWLARGGRDYDLVASPSPAGLVTSRTTVAAVRAGQGRGQWQECEATVTNKVDIAVRYYRVVYSK